MLRMLARRSGGARERYGTLRLWLPLTFFCALAAAGGAAAQAGAVSLRVDVAAPAGAERFEEGGVPSARITVPEGTRLVPVELDVVLATAIEPCASTPAACAGGESAVTRDEHGAPLSYGCLDGADNDADGLVDTDDPECTGVGLWAFSVETDASFHLRPSLLNPQEVGLTLSGTVADLDTRPPGLRDSRSENVAISARVRPDANGGRQGAVSIVVLSYMHPVQLPLVGESVVLKLRGDLDVSGLRSGEESAPSSVRILPPGEQGLRETAAQEPVSTFVSTLAGETIEPAVSSLRIVVSVSPPEFRRGDANRSGTVDMTDGVYILNHLFLGGERPTCLDAADTDDTGAVEITDGVAIFRFLFLGGTPPAAPGPSACGPDPSSDALECRADAPCP